MHIFGDSDPLLLANRCIARVSQHARFVSSVSRIGSRRKLVPGLTSRRPRPRKPDAKGAACFDSSWHDRGIGAAEALASLRGAVRHKPSRCRISPPFW